MTLAVDLLGSSSFHLHNVNRARFMLSVSFHFNISVDALSQYNSMLTLFVPSLGAEGLSSKGLQLTLNSACGNFFIAISRCRFPT